MECISKTKEKYDSMVCDLEPQGRIVSIHDVSRFDGETNVESMRNRY